MKRDSDQSDIERVREATDLVRLVGEHVALRPRGREHVGLCPFHDDHTPSMAVVTHKGGTGFYHCFSCGASGDCFRFVMDFHKMGFGEALRMLADRAGVALTPRSRSDAAAEDDGPSRDALLRALDYAHDFFRRTLEDPELGAPARDVIEARGIPADLVEKFAIGAAPPGFDGLHRTLGTKASRLAIAEAAGLIKARREGSGHYDTFRNRLIFPIANELGRTIAFGGRILDPEDNPKYLNSPESMLFRKSRTLYALHLAKRAIIAAGRAIVVEGYTDVIACHQAGIENVVGTLGTALTPEHARILSRLCDEVVLVFDGDEAGQKAADRGIEVFFREPVDVRICVLPDGQDPDDLLRAEDGSARFHAAVEASTEALAFKLDRFERGLAGVPGLSARQKRLEAFLRELGDLGFGGIPGVRKGLVLHRIADLLGLPVAEIERAIPRGAAPRATTPPPPTPDGDGSEAGTLIEPMSPLPAVSRARRIAEADLLGVLLFDSSAALDVALPDDLAAPRFGDPVLRAIATVLIDRVRRDAAGTSMSDVLAELDGSTAATATRLFLEGRRRVETTDGGASAALALAIDAFDDCLRREAYHSPSSEAAASADTDQVLDRIRQRQEHGYLPAAISHGLRS